jgi:hypothetical protein
MSGSMVLVALIALFVIIKSPVLKEPAPENVLEELVGDTFNESPKLIIPPSTLLIVTGPTMDGMVNTLFSHRFL